MGFCKDCANALPRNASSYNYHGNYGCAFECLKAYDDTASMYKRHHDFCERFEEKSNDK